jgi:hypothetical protein
MLMIHTDFPQFISKICSLLTPVYQTHHKQRGASIARPNAVYVRDLSPEEQQVLQERNHRTPVATIKTRFQIILLSASSMSVPQIAQVTFYSEDTVCIGCLGYPF